VWDASRPYITSSAIRYSKGLVHKEGNALTYPRYSIFQERHCLTLREPDALMEEQQIPLRTLRPSRNRFTPPCSALVSLAHTIIGWDPSEFACIKTSARLTLKMSPLFMPGASEGTLSLLALSVSLHRLCLSSLAVSLSDGNGHVSLLLAIPVFCLRSLPPETHQASPSNLCHVSPIAAYREAALSHFFQRKGMRLAQPLGCEPA
jgi:hypothetical protein